MIRAGEKLVLSLWSEQGFEARSARSAAARASRRSRSRTTWPPRPRSTRSSGWPGRSAPRRRPGQRRAWGGYTGYFADPDGFRWEIAMNPDPLGALVLP